MVTSWKVVWLNKSRERNLLVTDCVVIMTTVCSNVIQFRPIIQCLQYYLSSAFLLLVGDSNGIWPFKNSLHQQSPKALLWRPLQDTALPGEISGKTEIVTLLLGCTVYPQVHTDDQWTSQWTNQSVMHNIFVWLDAFWWQSRAVKMRDVFFYRYILFAGSTAAFHDHIEVDLWRRTGRHLPWGR